MFSALDNRTSHHVFDELFSPHGLLARKTVVMTSNSIAHYRAASHLIFLSANGRGCVQGTFATLSDREDFKTFLTAVEQKEGVAANEKQELKSALSPIKVQKALQPETIQQSTLADEEASLDQGSVMDSVMTVVKATGAQIVGSILLWAALIW